MMKTPQRWLCVMTILILLSSDTVKDQNQHELIKYHLSSQILI